MSGVRREDNLSTINSASDNCCFESWTETQTNHQY